jgi:hypothetical protein
MRVGEIISFEVGLRLLRLGEEGEIPILLNQLFYG